MAEKYIPLTIRLTDDSAHNARVINQVRSKVEGINNGFRRSSTFSIDDKQLREIEKRIKAINAAQQANNRASAGRGAGIGNAEFEGSLRRVQALIDLNRKEFDKAASSLRTMGKDTNATNNAIRQLEVELSRTQGRLNTAKERFQVTGAASKNMGVSLDIAANRMAKFDQVIDQTTRDLAKQSNQINESSGKLRSIAGGIQSAGLAITAAVTVPIIGIARLAQQSANQLQASRNLLIAFEGDATKAAARIQRLNEIADKSPGVTRGAAREQFAFLRAIKEIDPATIERNIAAIGKLSLIAGEGFNGKDFSRNLTQIFQQGFERGDIKEAIGRVPIFEQLLETAFGTKDGKKLKALKESGKLTLSGFLDGFSAAVQNDARLAALGETTAAKLEKGFERLKDRLAPIGERLLEIIVQVFDRISPILDRALNAFDALPQSAQTAVVVFGGIAAAIGPALLLLGSLATSISSLAGLFASGGLFAGVGVTLGSLAAPIGIVVAAVVGLAAAWQTNFGGIREITAREFEAVKAVFDQAMPAIQKAVTVVLDNIRGFWERHGAQITAVARAVWEVIAPIVSTALKNIILVIKGIAQIISGDWKGLFETLKTIASNSGQALVAILKGIGKLAWEALKLAVSLIIDNFKQTAKVFVGIGRDLINGLVDGIKAGGSSAINAVKNVALGLIAGAKGTLGIQSPSKEFIIIGSQVVDGMIVGIRSKAGEVKKLLKDLLKEATDAAREIAQAGNPQIFTAQNRNADLRETLSLQQEVFRLSREARGLVGAPFIDRLPTTVEGLESLRVRYENAIALNERLKESLDATARKAVEAVEKFQSLEQIGIPQPEVLRQLNEEIRLDPVPPAAASKIKISTESQQNFQNIGNKLGSFFTDALNATFERGIKGLGERIVATFKETFVRILAEIAKNAVLRVLFGGQGGASSTGIGGASSSSQGGILGNLLGSFGGGNNSSGGILGSLFGAPGGTAPFAGGSSSGGGILGAIAGLFGRGGASKLPTILPQIAGRLPLSTGVQGITGQIVSGKLGGLAPTVGSGAASGGLLASLGPQALLTGGGLLGSLAGDGPITKLIGAGAGTLLAGAAGAAGLFGGGVAAALPALFSNPITAIVGAGIIGGLLIKKFFFKGGELKKIKEAVSKFYGVKIDDKTAKQIQAFGKQNFGKNYIKQIDGIVQMEQVRSIVEAYAQASGQKGNNNLVDTSFLENANDPRNIRNVSRGIEPPVVSVSSLGAASAPPTSSASASASGMGNIANAIGAVISQKLQPLSDFAQSLSTTSATQILTVGASESPVVFQQAANEAARSNPVNNFGSRRLAN